MPRIHRLEHVERFATPHFAHDDAIRTHPQRVDDQIAGSNAAQPFDIRRPRLHAHDVILVEGFPTLEAARLYARRYTWATVEEMKEVPDSHTAFLIYGETARVVGDEYTTWHDEVDYFFAHEPTAEDTDWESLEKKYRVKKTYGR